MYQSSIGGVAGGVTSAATLPLTGLSLGWQLALAATMIAAGAALVRLTPRLRGRRG